MGGLERLGLKCNPFRAALAESVGDPCRLVVAGGRHRRLLRSIVEAATEPGAPRLYVVTGPWGVGKTTVALRALCELRLEGLDPLHVYIQATDALRAGGGEPLLALALETAARVWRGSRRPLPDGRVEADYPAVASWARGAARPAGGCGAARGAMAEAVGFIVRQAVEERRPLYIVYDQFEHLVASKPECVGVADFTIYFVKELFHAVARAAERGYKPRLVIVEALHSNFMYRFQAELDAKGAPLAALLGGAAVAWSLEPFESPLETRELVDLYLTETGCAASPQARSLFTDEAVERLHYWSGGLPRSIVELASRAVEEAAAAARGPPIDAVLVDEVAVASRLSPAAARCLRRVDELLEGGRLLPRLPAMIYRAYALHAPIDGLALEPVARGSRVAAVLVSLDDAGERVLVAAARARLTRRTVEALAAEARARGATRVVVVTAGGQPSLPALQAMEEARAAGVDFAVARLDRDRALAAAAACIAAMARGERLLASPEDLRALIAALAGAGPAGPRGARASR